MTSSAVSRVMTSARVGPASTSFSSNVLIGVHLSSLRCSRPEAQGKGERAGKARARKIYDAVRDQAPPLDGRSEQAVQQVPGERGPAGQRRAALPHKPEPIAQP